MTRELLWELIRGNPNYKQEDKPQKITDIMKLSFDEEPKKIKPKKITPEDIKIYEKMCFGIK
jgi:hypothetical protein